ncbi:MAG: hypothetical protein PQJ61_07155 [Spirochaetales bacterium]|uniref:Tetratricopeptide repeat protein n=1 Tax=Candidatus Thalassospirochaeta sargassi TaxID=3119039 RepID=A0AAJ1IG16_9SPIO|nr:hypothetical protein [Spirochaetales bacterium]
MNLAAQNGALDGDNLRKPVFPEGSSGLIFIEGEDAVSTNFANQAVSNFSASGYRTVQLNRNTGLQGGAAFYAEFVFYAEETAEYEFWYGGTPPGPSDDLTPSYASPLSVRIDDGETLKLYREDVKVVEGYSPSYYWNSCFSVKLSEGSHKLRLEVSEPRGYDGRYFFYLDSLFFLNRAKTEEVKLLSPEIFPESLDSDVVDNPFLSLPEYQAYIDANPDDTAGYVELSLVYSLIGDYLSALKTLNRAMAIDAADPYPVVLAAKNRLWKGDIRESLGLYDRALEIDPGDRLLWTEAGKVAAWSAEYERSIDFFERGLQLFPDDLNMMVNLGLTYIWMARDVDADETFRSALKSASGDPKRLSLLGWIEEAVGYPEYARDVYLESIELYPDFLEFYLLLQSSYLASGDRSSADDVGMLIESTFRSSERLQNELEIYRTKLNLRDQVIESYLERLRAEPGNLELRQELAQTFFWNGMSTEAIEQIKYVVTTYSYRAADTYSRRNAELFSLIDSAAALMSFFENFPSAASASEKAVAAARAELTKAQKAAEETAETSILRQAEQGFADALENARRLSDLMRQKAALLEDLRTQTEQILIDEKAEDEAFRAVVASSGWQWDRAWQEAELTSIMSGEPELASYMLGRLLISEKKYSKAAGVLAPAPDNAGSGGVKTAETAGMLTSEADAADGANNPAAAKVDYSKIETGPLYALYQSFLLGGDTGADTAVSRRAFLAAQEGERLAADYPHLAQTEVLLADASSLFDGSAVGIYYEALADESVDVLKRLDETAKEAGAGHKDSAAILNKLKAIALKELERANYYLEADTYLIRYELGNYYLEEGFNKEASEQFKRVIALDPWNISAAYKLGVVEQRYGNWSEAMEQYKKVYYQDPDYENAVTYFNQLARLHADGFDTNILLTASPSEISFSGSMSYSTEFNNLLGLQAVYEFDQPRQYRDFTDQPQGAYQLHMAELSLPLTMGNSGLIVAPSAGIYLENIYYKEDYFFYSEETVSLSEFFAAISSYPKYGASLQWSTGFLALDGSWEYAIEHDSLYAGRSIIRKNDFELNANTWFVLDDYDFLGPLTTRSYGRLQLMSDGNTKWQLYQNALLGFNLLSKPVIRVTPGASINFEKSTDTSVTDYYAPPGVLEAKGTLRAAFTFPSSDWTSALEAVLWGGAGGYWENLGEDPYVTPVEGSLKLEGGLGATFVKNGNMYFLNASGLGTFAGGENEYWELSVSLSTALNNPGLLTP